MSLPNSRNETYVDGTTQIPAQTMNDLQDGIVALQSGRTTGQKRVWQENFLWNTNTITSTETPITGYAPLCAGINGAGSSVDFTYAGPGGYVTGSDYYLGRLVALTGGGANGRYANISSTASYYVPTAAGNGTKMEMTFEQEVAIADKTVGDYRIGLTDSPTGLTNFVGLRHLHTDTNWILVTSAGTFTVTSSTPTNNVIQRFKIVLSGKATPAGVANSNTEIVRVYLNDALVLSQSGAFYTDTGAVYAICDSRATGASGSLAVFGGWTQQWNAWG